MTDITPEPTPPVAAVPDPTNVTAIPETLTAEQRQSRLGALIYNEVRDGWRVESQGQFEATLVKGKQHSHLLHVILCVITFGLWIPVWILLSIFGGQKHKYIGIDLYGNTFSKKV